MDDKKYLIHFEIMRIFAVFFVIFNHTGSNGFFLFTSYDYTSMYYWLYLFLSIFCRVSVPLFFAISGALLLKKDTESIGIIWKNRILKILSVLILFSFISYIYNICIGMETFNIKRFFIVLGSTGWNYSYWYLYAFIAFLMGLPFLRAMVKNLETPYFYYMIILAVFFDGVLPVFQYLFSNGTFWYNGDLRISWLVSNIVLYPCIGYFLEHKLNIFKDKFMILKLWIVNLITLSISCYVTYYKIKITGDAAESTTQLFHSSFVLINCITIFCTIKFVCMKYKINNIIEKFILSLGRSTFGIYLIHSLVLWRPEIFILLDFLKINLGFNAMISIMIFCFIVLMLCYLIVLILKRIPAIKKIL